MYLTPSATERFHEDFSASLSEILKLRFGPDAARRKQFPRDFMMNLCEISLTGEYPQSCPLENRLY
jgi:hypothetical protein